MSITRRSLFAAAASLPVVSALPVAAAAAAAKRDVDVLVVGGGFSGLAAAVTALRNGAKTLLIEKRAVVGGDGVLSSGTVQSSHNVLHDKQGIEGATFEEHWQRYISGKEDEPLGRVRDNSELSPVYFGLDKHNIEVQKKAASYGPKVVEFLLSIGVEFMPINPLRPFQVAMKRGGTSAAAMGMKKEIEAKGGEIRTKTRAMSLITDGERVVGANVKSADGKEYAIYAGAVVLATGGFLDNDYLFARYKPFWKNLPKAISAYGEDRVKDHTGDGIIMGKAIGAALESMETMPKVASRMQAGQQFISWLTTDEEPCFIVNRHGKRVCDENKARYAGVCLALARQGETYGYLVIGDESVQGPNNARFRYTDGMKTGSVFKADTPEELAKIVGIDPKAFREQFDKYQADAAKGVDTEFGRTDKLFRPLKAPYYITSKGHVVVFKTEGGLEVDPNFQVLRQSDDQPIPGLYAAGSGCGSVSTRNSDVIAGGMIAGENAAKEAKSL